jgi:hypothetical protein
MVSECKMLETFLTLFTAHLVTDFTLQSDWMIHQKRRPLVLCLHALLVGLTAVIAAGTLQATLLAMLVVSHLAMDIVKVHLMKDTLISFILDQGFHLAVIAALAIVFPATVAEGWWASLPSEWLSLYFATLCLVAGLIASLQFGAVMIRKSTKRFADQISNQIEGLDNGGYYIGCLERALVFLLILIDQPAGVGFLITAKSILRFGDVKESSQRKLTEYIIIGTFTSFGWGLLTAVVTRLGVQHWLLSSPG